MGGFPLLRRLETYFFSPPPPPLPPFTAAFESDTERWGTERAGQGTKMEVDLVKTESNIEATLHTHRDAAILQGNILIHRRMNPGFKGLSTGGV